MQKSFFNFYKTFLCLLILICYQNLKGQNSIKTKKQTSLTVDETDRKITIKNKKITVSVDKTTGYVTSFSSKGKEMMQSPLKLNFWRPETENDAAYRRAKKQTNERDWLSAGDNFIVKNINANQSEKGIVSISVFGEIAKPKTTVNLKYMLFGDGKLTVDYEVDIDKSGPNIPKIGMQFDISNRFKNVTYLGKGPQANYQDRNTGALLGLYKAEVSKMNYKYAVPQEYGNRMHTNWFQLEDSSKKGIHISGKQPLNFSVLEYSTNNIEKAKHTNELIKRDFFSVNIDLIQMGVGGDNTWSAKAEPHIEYLLKPKKYSYSFSISPL